MYVLSMYKYISLAQTNLYKTGEPRQELKRNQTEKWNPHTAKTTWNGGDDVITLALTGVLLKQLTSFQSLFKMKEM